MSDLQEAIGKLAALYEYGALQASTAPTEFLLMVADEIRASRDLAEAAKKIQEAHESGGFYTEAERATRFRELKTALQAFDQITGGDDGA